METSEATTTRMCFFSLDKVFSDPLPVPPTQCEIVEVSLKLGLEMASTAPSHLPRPQELKNNKIEEDLDRGLSGAGHHLSSLGAGAGGAMQVNNVHFTYITPAR